MNNRDKILDKIKKLIAKQKSALEIGSVEEADTFAAKIQDLLVKYNVSIGDISFEDRKANVSQKKVSTRIKSVSDRMGYHMMYVVAKHNLCRVYNYEKSFEMLLVGTPGNIEICEMLYDLMLSVYISIGKRKYQEMEYYVGLDTFLREFLTGCKDGLDAKYKAEKLRLEQANPGCTSLIIYNDKAIVEYVNTVVVFSKRKTAQKAEKPKSDVYWEGYHTGKKTNLQERLD